MKYAVIPKIMAVIRITVVIACLYTPFRTSLLSLSEQIAVDNCLDLGGSFNITTMTCDFEHSSPYIPFVDRHSRLLRATGWSIVIGLTLVAATYCIPTTPKCGHDHDHD